MDAIVGDNAALKQDVQVLRDENVAHKQDVQVLRDDNAALKQDVQALTDKVALLELAGNDDGKSSATNHDAKMLMVNVDTDPVPICTTESLGQFLFLSFIGRNGQSLSICAGGSSTAGPSWQHVKTASKVDAITKSFEPSIERYVPQRGQSLSEAFGIQENHLSSVPTGTYFLSDDLIGFIGNPLKAGGSYSRASQLYINSDVEFVGPPVSLNGTSFAMRHVSFNVHKGGHLKISNLRCYQVTIALESGAHLTIEDSELSLTEDAPVIRISTTVQRTSEAPQSKVVIRRSQFSLNSKSVLHNTQAQVTIDGCTFFANAGANANSQSGTAGVIFQSGPTDSHNQGFTYYTPTLDVTNSVFKKNYGYHGGVYVLAKGFGNSNQYNPGTLAESGNTYENNVCGTSTYTNCRGTTKCYAPDNGGCRYGSCGNCDTVRCNRQSYTGYGSPCS